MSISRYISEWVNYNPGKAVGAAAGFILGLLILIMGIAKTILIVLFILLGYTIGRMVDERVSVFDEFRNIFKRK
jgi:uncharacterized membrane protein